ncbi:hypothetical protein BNJ_00187 [Kaumoebavirus]|uniref:hypothetical protein n=1 Tax=Kaumoebavirus TaxID=1859492 RepID=UPI0009C1DD13|nr:hypothetical protein BNJ_00187 [Kaumoebavirus]ARA72018.1 hypothetical protein BNJ_00187 [Kaumoebavirus]
MYNSNPEISIHCADNVQPKIYTQVQNDFGLARQFEDNGIFSMFVWVRGDNCDKFEYNNVLRIKDGYAWLHEAFLP